MSSALTIPVPADEGESFGPESVQLNASSAQNRSAIVDGRCLEQDEFIAYSRAALVSGLSLSNRSDEGNIEFHD